MLPDFFRDTANHLLSSAAVAVTLVSALFALALWQYRRLTRPGPAGLIALLLCALLVMSMTDPTFLTIVSKPDNVPILFMVALVGFCSWWAFRQAAINDERIEQGRRPSEADPSEEQKTYVWPDLVLIEFICLIIVSVGLLVWSILLKAPLEQPANPASTPNPSKAPWYFLGLQEMLVYFDPWIAGVVLPTMIIIGLCAIPYLDKNPKGNGYYTFKERKFAISIWMYGFLILWVFLVYMGTFMRGPNWNFFGPYEPWDIHKLEALTSVNLSEIIFMRWLGQAMPALWFVREIPGFAILAVYFGLAPLVLAKTAMRKFYVVMGMCRYMVLMNLFLCMLGMVLKMYLRWMFNLKYLVATPYFNI